MYNIIDFFLYLFYNKELLFTSDIYRYRYVFDIKKISVLFKYFNNKSHLLSIVYIYIYIYIYIVVVIFIIINSTFSFFFVYMIFFHLEVVWSS